MFCNDNFKTTMSISDKFSHLIGFFGGVIVFLHMFTNPFWVNLIFIILAPLWEIIELAFGDCISWKDIEADYIGLILANIFGITL